MAGFAYTARRLESSWRRLRPWATPTRRRDRSVRGQYGLELALLVALYYVAAHVEFAFQFAGPVASVVWLPVGVGIAVLYLRGLWLWPGIVIGDLLVNNYSALPVGSAVGQTFGNLLEVVIAAVLLRRLVNRDAPLATRSSLAGVFVAIAVGHGGQRDDRLAVAVARRRDPRRDAPPRMADLVAGRLLRRRDRAAARAGVVPAAATKLAAGARAGDRVGADRGLRPELRRVARRASPELPGLPRARMGRGSARPARGRRSPSRSAPG